MAAIAAAMGFEPTSGGALVTDLKSYLRARRLVLVLDELRAGDGGGSAGG